MPPIFPDWNFSQWHAVDDRVRGGSSQSHLDPIHVEGDDSVFQSKDEKKVAARFWGTLDIKTLGGAGFASQKYQFGPEPLHLPLAQYQGISLHLLPQSATKSAPKTFTLVLKTDTFTRSPSKPRTPPSPDPASLSYEHSFQSTSNAQLVDKVDLAFTDFIPTYRGRPVKRDDPRYKPLDPAKVYELSLMCRSDFGKQEGDFEVVVQRIEGWARDKKGDREREGCWGGLRRWLGWDTGVKL